MKLIGFAAPFVCVFLAGCSRNAPQEQAVQRCVQQPALPADPIPRGHLGSRLGTYLTIEGIRAEHGKVSANAMVVDTVNGRGLDEPVTIVIENYRELPRGARCVFNGYESGKMIGLPYEVAEKEHMDLPQAGWQFYHYFIMTSVVSVPAGPAVEPERDRPGDIPPPVRKVRPRGDASPGSPGDGATLQ